jgi:hypothetical protein
MEFAFNRCPLRQLITPAVELLSPGRSFFLSGQPRDALPRFFVVRSAASSSMVRSDPMPARHKPRLLFEATQRLARQMRSSILGLVIRRSGPWHEITVFLESSAEISKPVSSTSIALVAPGAFSAGPRAAPLRASGPQAAGRCGRETPQVQKPPDEWDEALGPRCRGWGLVTHQE